MVDWQKSKTRSPLLRMRVSSRSSSASFADADTMCSPSTKGSGSAPSKRYGWLQLEVRRG